MEGHQREQLSKPRSMHIASLLGLLYPVNVYILENEKKYVADEEQNVN